jgi:hypothetical protein
MEGQKINLKAKEIVTIAKIYGVKVPVRGYSKEK